MSRRWTSFGRVVKLPVICLVVSGVVTCKSRTDLSDTAADDASRQIIGMDHPYPGKRRDDDELEQSLAKRRALGWEIAHSVFTPVPQVGFEGANTNPNDDLALWQTWFTSDEIVKMFEVLYRSLPPERRATIDAGGDASVTDAEIECALKKYASEDYLKRRYGSLYNKMILKRIAQLKERSSRSLNGVALGVTVFNLPLAKHYLANYARVIRCNEQVADSYDGDLERNFAPCFNDEFPHDAVAIKAVWARDEDRIELYDTTAKGISEALSREKVWRPRSCGAETCAVLANDPQLDQKMYWTNKLNTAQQASKYRLTAIHIATKEVRDWTWTTLWWSDTPDSDYGADRPAWFGTYAGHTTAPLKNYKMCIATAYRERDAAILAKVPGFRVRDDDRSLEGAVLASYVTGNVRPGGAADDVVQTWCSNPYIEKDHEMADTNCIGCHQHAGPSSDMANVRHQERKVFPADYAWSFEFYMDMIAKENDNFKDKLLKLTANLATEPQDACASP